jgi:maleate isomerase
VIDPYRIGLIVPSSNTTMETEIPEMLRRREATHPERFTFHGSRMRMRHVSAEELATMDRDSDRCALELSDAHCDVLAYACLVAIMSQGPGYHCQSQDRLRRVTEENGAPAPVVSSAGALVDALDLMGVQRIAIVTPYVRELTDLVAGYIEDSGVRVVDSVSLEVADNIAVGRLDPAGLLDHYRKLDLSDAEAIVLSACVQMPSLASVQRVEDESGLPVLSSAGATVHAICGALGLEPVVPDAGHLLSGKVPTRSRPGPGRFAEAPSHAVGVDAERAVALTGGAE